MNRILKFALFSALGFGLGWLLKEVVFQMKIYGYWVVLEFVEGALGGLALGLASKTGAKRIALMAAFTGIGLAAGVFIGNKLGQLLSLRSVIQYLIAYGLFTGVFGGLAVGFVLGGWKKAAILALAGAIAFAVLPFTLQLWRPLMYGLGFIGGGLFGAAVGYLEKG